MPVDHDEQLLEAAQEASQRSRNATYALLIFCVLLGAIALNQVQQFSWMDERYQLHRYAHRLYQCPMDPPGLRVVPAIALSTDAGVDRSMDAGALPQRGSDRYDERVTALVDAWVEACREFLPREKDAEERAKRAAHYIIEQDLHREDVQKITEELVEGRVEHMYLLPLPLIDVKVDGNVAGLFASFGHFVLLVWLFVAIKQEILLMDRVCLHLRDGYALLRYRSFFMASTDEATMRFRRFLTAMVWTLVWLPLLLSTLLFYADLKSVVDSVGQVYRPDLLVFYLLAEGAAVFLGAALAWRLFVMVRVLGRGAARGHVDWERMSPAGRIEWVLKQLCWCSPHNPAQCDGRTVTDILWMKHGALLSDVAPILDALTSEQGVRLLLAGLEPDGKEALRERVPSLRADVGAPVIADGPATDRARYRLVFPTDPNARFEFVMWRRRVMFEHEELFDANEQGRVPRAAWAPYWYWGLETEFRRQIPRRGDRRWRIPSILQRAELLGILMGVALWSSARHPWQRWNLWGEFAALTSKGVLLVLDHRALIGEAMLVGAAVLLVVPRLLRSRFEGSTLRVSSFALQGDLQAVAVKADRWLGLRRVIVKDRTSVRTLRGFLLHGELEQDDIEGRDRLMVLGDRRFGVYFFKIMSPIARSDAAGGGRSLT